MSNSLMVVFCFNRFDDDRIFISYARLYQFLLNELCTPK